MSKLNKEKLDDYIMIFEKYPQKSLKINRLFYFDESNNIRKCIIDPKKHNKCDLKSLFFVLGGISISKKINFNKLIKYVGGRQTPSDAKFLYFSKGHNDFLQAINQQRLCKLFEYLIKNDILIHFSVDSYLYWAIIDILDSLIEEDDVNQKAALMYYHTLQSDMFEVLCKNYDALLSILISYQFPNISKNRVNSFIKDIYELYINNFYYFYEQSNPDNFTKELLRQIIKAKLYKKSLLFLENNEDYVILDSLDIFYISRMVVIKDIKYFDDEPLIRKKLIKLDPQYKNKLKCSFLDSKKCREIQISDAICGFVSKLYNFLSCHDENYICHFVHSLDKKQNAYKTLKNFICLMTLSDDISELMFCKTLPIYIEKRFALIFQLFNK